MCSFVRSRTAQALEAHREERRHPRGARTAQALEAHREDIRGEPGQQSPTIRRVGSQDSASAPTPHPRSPCPYRSTGVSIFRILYCDWYRNIEMYLTPYHMKEPNSYEVRPRKTPPAFSTSPGL